MKSEVSERLDQSIEFLIDNKIITTRLELARRLRVTASTLSMATTGRRTPALKLLLDYCEMYPVSLDWLRTGRGEMIRQDRTSDLLRKIDSLEKENAELKAQLLLFGQERKKGNKK